MIHVKKLTRTLSKSFSTSLYVWNSNVSPGLRKEDYTNRYTINNTPHKVEFFEGLNPKYVYTGPRHSAVISEKGELYTFGSGNFSVLGHGEERNVNFPKAKKVEYFENHGIKIKKVCLGDYHSICLSEDGNVFSWGFGGKKGFLGIFWRDIGALGHGNIDNVFFPKKIKYFEENNIKIKDIACGTRHCVALSENGDVYTWGKGDYGLLGNGSNKDSLIPMKNEILDIFAKENPENSIVKIDCADEYTGALTKGGNLYVWGKNNQGQLGIGSGIGVDFIESEKYPNLIVKNKNQRFVDFSCGENCMMVMDSNSDIYKTGWRIDYTPSLISLSRSIKTKFFFCGNSYLCIIDEHNKIYQWGNLFKQKIAEKTDSDMQMITTESLFDGKEIQMISGKFKVCAAIVKA